MPPVVHAAAPAHAPDAAADAALPLDLLARICSFLPPGDAVLTVPRLNKALAAAAAPRVAAVRAEAQAAKDAPNQECVIFKNGRFPFGVEIPSIPLWALQEAWPQLQGRQRTRAAGRAAFHGDLAVLSWALLRPLDLAMHAAQGVCEAAAAGGQLEALECARALGCPWDGWTCKAAAKSGQLAVLQWARTQQPPCPWGVDTCVAAAEGGHLAVLQWLRAQKPPCPWERETCSAAAWDGQLAVLQWLRAQQPPCPWDGWTCARAAQSGQLAVLQWARAQQPPCPWNEDTCSMAAQSGHLAVLQWARAQQPPCPWDARGCFMATRRDEDHATAEWIRAQAALEGAAL
ncbi:hypothetical protein Rsub_02685 [Raphidocelis subcapitata]|uniref:F-box domain-containing protein n=1 Tax=Raphidocelis subcapitata TaxID=307507 RepID=A0A2V0NRM8_9CHLO|nr:hypothetical protein Rsub_02685 [Raphidocelis subcapitata]|eukprot:GBF89979.1 hypothetical protein Rsub_02685 [Raphidocelis subcapitata]